MRQPLPSACVQADEAGDDLADSLGHLLGPGPSRPLRVGGPQRREERQAAGPPSPDQVARLLNLVWSEDEEFGLYLWTAFTTGARRGEASALRENRFDFARPEVRLARNYLVK
jgi:integrase